MIIQMTQIASVDFGHTFSPVIEMRSLENDKVKSLKHGEAVFWIFCYHLVFLTTEII